MGKVVSPETLPASVVRPQEARWERALPASDSRDDELLLVDLWLILKSRKLLILAVFLSAVLCAAVLSFVVSPIYESRAVVEIGKVAGLPPNTIQGLSAGAVQTIEDPVVTLQRLREAYGLEGHDRPKGLPYLDSIGHPRSSGQSLIVFTAHGRTPKEAQAFLVEVTRPLLERHYELYEQVRSTKEVQTRALERQIETLEAQAGKLANVGKNVDPGQAAIITLERGNLLSALGNLGIQRSNLALSLTAVGSYPTRLIQDPTLAFSAIRPNPPLYLLLSVVVGLALGIAMALILEFLASAREISRIRERRTTEQANN